MYDFDNDGWKDLFFALSHLAQTDRYRGTAIPSCRIGSSAISAGKRFEDVSAAAGPDFQRAAMHRGVAFADFDNDGRIDAVVSVVNGPAKLFHNIIGRRIALAGGPAAGAACESSGTRRRRPRAAAGWPRSVQPGHYRGGVRVFERSLGAVRTGLESGGGNHRDPLAGRRHPTARERVTADRIVEIVVASRSNHDRLEVRDRRFASCARRCGAPLRLLRVRPLTKKPTRSSWKRSFPKRWRRSKKRFDWIRNSSRR